MPSSGRPVLGELERAIMDHLWRADATHPHGVTVREVHDDVGVARSLAYTTLMTVLDRLHTKGLVTRVRDGRAWRYVAAQGIDTLAADTLHRTLGELAGDDRRAALRAFLSDSTPAELAELRQALDEYEAGLTRQGGRSGRRGVTRHLPSRAGSPS